MGTRAVPPSDKREALALATIVSNDGYGFDHDRGAFRDVAGMSRSLGQLEWTERVCPPVLCAKTLDRAEFGIAAGNRRGACVKLALKAVGSCRSDSGCG